MNFNKTTQLTEAQVAQSDQGPKFEGVQWPQIFGPAGDGALANRIYNLSPRRYRELRQQWRWDTNQEKRPDNFFDK